MTTIQPHIRVYESIDSGHRIDTTDTCKVQYLDNNKALVMFPPDDNGDEIHVTVPTYGISVVTLTGGIIQCIVTWEDDEGRRVTKQPSGVA